MLIWFLSDHCILCLALKVGTRKVVWQDFCLQIVVFQPIFNNIHLRFSTHACFEVRFQSVLSKYENAKNIFL